MKSRNICILSNVQSDLTPLLEVLNDSIGEHDTIVTVKSLQGLQASYERSGGLDLIFIDAIYGDSEHSGTECIKTIRESHGQVPIVGFAETGDVDSAARVIKAGASDFLVLGDNLHERIETLLVKVDAVISLLHRNRKLRERNQELAESMQEKYEIFTTSKAMHAILQQVERVASVPRPVFIIGERGTGKELVAQAIHRAGNPTAPFITVNCAAFPDNLLESELFGYVKGAFTGADSVKPGKFEQADKGTLFLDEIGNMTPAFQQKILRVVEYGVYTPLGSSTEMKTSARIIAATNADLQDMMEKGEFMRDLYDRLSFETITIPPLRERKEDIEILSQRFLDKFMREIPTFQGKCMSESAIKALKNYSFPGNVRELKNIIERAAYRDTTNEITMEDIGFLAEGPTGIQGDSFMEKVENYKKMLISEAMAKAENNQAKAAKLLGLGYHQFRHYLMKTR